MAHWYHGQRGGTGGIAAAVLTMAASCGILCSGAASAQALGFPGQYDEPVVRGPSRPLPALVMLQGVFGLAGLFSWVHVRGELVELGAARKNSAPSVRRSNVRHLLILKTRRASRRLGEASCVWGVLGVKLEAPNIHGGARMMGVGGSNRSRRTARSSRSL